MSRPRRQNINKYGVIFCIPFILFFVLFNLVPMIFSVVISFTNWDGMTMDFIGIQNYQRLLQDANFWKSIQNSFVLLVLISTPLTMIFCLLLTYFVSFKLKRLARPVQVISLIPYFTSTIAVGAIFSFLFNKNIGIVNSVLVNLGILESPTIEWLGDPMMARVIVILINQWTYVGYTSIFFITGMASISDEIIEAAVIDGAKEFRIFWSICLPMMKKITYFVILTSVIGAFQQLEQEFMMFTGGIFGSNYPVGGPDASCLTMGLNFYSTSFISLQYGYGASIGMSNAVIIGVSSVILNAVMKRSDNA